MRRSLLVVLLTMLAMLVQACGNTAPTSQPTTAAEPAPPTQAPAATEPTSVPADPAEPTRPANPNEKILFGSVTDSNGNPLAGVKIYVIAGDGSERVGAETDADGAFELSLPLGTYSFEARADGYQPYRNSNVDISMIDILPMRLESGQASVPSGSGLDSLKSYREVFAFSYDGMFAGKPVKGTIDQTHVVQRDGNQASNLVSYKGDPFGDVNPSFDAAEYQIGNQFYTTTGPDGQASCSESSEPNPLLTSFQPISIIREVNEYGSSQGEETVNGIASTRHKIERKQEGVSTYTADVWLAKDGGYIVKSVGSIVYEQQVIRADMALGVLPFTLDKGTVNWTYNLSDVNAPLTVEKPASCANQQAIGGLPLPASASGISSSANFTSFRSTETPDALEAFYMSELKNAGWEASSAKPEGVNGFEVTASKDGASYSILIMGGNDGSSVIMTMK